MTIAEIKELIQVFNESNVAEMEVQRGENRLRLRRTPTFEEITAQGPAVPAAAGNPMSLTPAQPHVAPAKTAPLDPSHTLVKSPIVGTYYDAPSPGAPSFVNIGDSVEPGQ